jgi:hypothetical protein
MIKPDDKPWVKGPLELLGHARSHLPAKTGLDARMAFISIDNAVEVAIRTYLGLPKRARGRDGPPRKVLDGAYFPDLLDLLDQHAGDLLEGIDLSDIEWYHRLRNDLYHGAKGGLTVDLSDIDNYLTIATVLLRSLFKVDTGQVPIGPTGAFIEKWTDLENRIKTLAQHNGLSAKEVTRAPPTHLVSKLVEAGQVAPDVLRRVSEMQTLRNNIVHGRSVPGWDAHGILSQLDALMAEFPPWKRDVST